MTVCSALAEGPIWSYRGWDNWFCYRKLKLHIVSVQFVHCQVALCVRPACWHLPGESPAGPEPLPQFHHIYFTSPFLCTREDREGDTEMLVCFSCWSLRSLWTAFLALQVDSPGSGISPESGKRETHDKHLLAKWVGHSTKRIKNKYNSNKNQKRSNLGITAAEQSVKMCWLLGQSSEHAVCNEPST